MKAINGHRYHENYSMPAIRHIWENPQMFQ